MFEQYGLIQLGKDIPVIKKSGRIYVVTHPYFEDDVHPYIDQLEGLIRDATEPILTLDSAGFLVSGKDGSTLVRYSKLNPQGDRFFLQNGFCYAEPECGWEKTALIINGFEPKEVIFGGSQLGGNEADGYYHCVGLSYESLKSLVPNARIDESISARPK